MALLSARRPPTGRCGFLLLTTLLSVLVAGCGSDDDGGAATPTRPAPTATPPDPEPTEPVLCSVFGTGASDCPSPTPTLAPCTGAAQATCAASCAAGQGCCLPGGTPQCFDADDPPVTLCTGTTDQVCLLVATPTPTATPTATGTATVTTTRTATATPTATDTPEGGIPTPTLPPGTCDNQCGDNGPPAGCTPLAPNGDSGGATPPDLVVSTCLAVGSGLHVYRYVNVVDGGMLYFADDGGDIDFRASSVLAQQGGTVKAGSWCCPFGSYGGSLDIGLWGSDPTDQGKAPPPPAAAGIGCVNPSGTPTPCFAHELALLPHYCTVSGSDDPCSSETPPAVGDNALFEGHIDHGAGGLPFDAGASFGYKVLAVTYGGSLELFGAKGVAAAYRVDPSTADAACAVPAADEQHAPAAWAALSGASWARLDAPALAQSSTLVVDRAVDWEQGDRLVVGSTDWHAGHSETVVIAGVESDDTFSLSTPLAYGHNGTLFDITDGIPNPPSANQQVETRAAVGLLSRDIRVHSLGATYRDPFPSAADCGYQGDASGNATTPPDCYFGGHVIARQGFRTFQVQGVEFAELGQGGRLAHYPVHFHLAKSTAYTNAFVKDSSIHASMTRLVTIHGTHDVTVARNVGYLSVGHGYYIEDGSEIDNRLCHNLAVSVQGATVEYFQAQDPDSPTHRFSPPILPSVQDAAQTATPPYGSDAYFPVGFWAMNTWNELVGNQVVGVGGFGSCYWLLGAGVSGPSKSLSWSSSTSTPAGYAKYNVAAQRQAPLKRFRGNGCSTAQYALQTTLAVDPPAFGAAQYGYTAALNPYDITTDMLPEVAGDYLPVLIGGIGCADQRTMADTGGNAASCSLTLIDRFTTSFNWAPVDFGAIWLRPQFFAFTNGAVTDQLFGGLTFVSGGAWTQSPPGYFTITQDSLYVGTTQRGGISDAGRAGPAFDLSSCAQNACPLPADGTALFTQGFQPKRLINIYDGPFFADGNAFANAQPFGCDAAQVDDGNTPQCGIYMSTVQPRTCHSPPVAPAGSDMCVINAAVGWKQPNGFYYPPAFAFENTAFDAESARHNVVDQYQPYIQGNLANPAQPTIYDPLRTYTGITPIDSSTILNDLDGTFTGTCWGTDCDAQSLPSPQRRTASVSANRFFDAPSQSPECQSYGVQTAPNEFLTTVIAPLTADESAIDPTVWTMVPPFPAVPIYRQRLLAGEVACTGAICDGATWSCDHATFMVGAQNGQAPYLTDADGVYYLDTNTAAQTTTGDRPYPGGQTTDCIPGGNYQVATFTAGQSYVLYQLFVTDDARTTYQIYTGGADGQWAWVQPHLSTASGPVNNMAVTPISDPSLVAALNANVTQHVDGVTELVFDSSLIADQFAFTARAADEKCLPRDACQVQTGGAQCALAADFTEPGLTTTVGAICEKWATRVAGTTPDSQGLSLSDCPASGCLGYIFTLPSGWTPQPYGTVGAGRTTCFPDDALWNRPLQVITQDLDVCPDPTPASGFCPAPTPTPTPLS
jgi:hypothetical protein